MLIRVSGGSSGIGSYLAEGRKSGRDYNRDELDQRFLLSGDLQHLEAILASFDQNNEHQKYLHITLSFKEREIPEEVLQSIDQEFQQFLFAACAEGEFYYYSEGHLPKIKSLPDVLGNERERFPHIHAVVPEFNLISGKRENPLGKIEHITHYINAFQEAINQKYHLESPKDNLRPVSGGREEILNRYRISPEMSATTVKEKIANIIYADTSIDTVDKLADTLKAFGEVEIRDSERFGERYINFRFANDKKAVNLKDPIFLSKYLADRDPSMATSAPQENYTALVEKWMTRRALEVRFIDRASIKQKEDYQQMEEAEQLAYLKRKFAEKIKQTERAELQEGQILPAQYADKLPQWQPKNHIDSINHFEDFPHIDDLPHINELDHIDDLPYYQPEEIQGEYIEQWHNDSKGEPGYDLHDLRSRPDYGNSGKREAVEPDSLPANARDDVDGNSQVKFADVYRVRDGGAISLYEQYAPAPTVDVNWTERIQQTDLNLLLDYLAYHYRIRREDFAIEKNRNGVERIKINGRRYSASDLMKKYLNLRWPEIRKVLDAVWEAQQQQSTLRTRDVTSRTLWHRWRQYEAGLPGTRAAYSRYRASRSDIWQRLRFVADEQQTPAQNRTRRQLLQQQRLAELQRLHKAWQKEDRYYRLPQRERYQEWLHGEAEQGDVVALDELQRVARYAYPDDHLQLLPTSRQQSLFAPFELGLKVHIKRNGEIEYRDDKEKAVIIDARDSIRVIRRDHETIVKALKLAQQRFGTDAFEIRNAGEEDRQIIQKAVNEVRVEVKMIQDKHKGRSIIERG